MSWLNRLKKTESPCLPTLQNPQNPIKGGFVGFVASPLGGIEKIERLAVAANEAVQLGTLNPKVSPRVDALPLNLDRWCWPVSSAMNAEEIDTFTARLVRFTDKGVNLHGSEALAGRLVIRDREQDTRRVCMECIHLNNGRRCANWKTAGVANQAQDAQLPTEFVLQLQHCHGFTALRLATNPKAQS